jgi:hypothetical protein
VRWRSGRPPPPAKSRGHGPEPRPGQPSAPQCGASPGNARVLTQSECIYNPGTMGDGEPVATESGRVRFGAVGKGLAQAGTSLAAYPTARRVRPGPLDKDPSGHLASGPPVLHTVLWCGVAGHRPGTRLPRFAGGRVRGPGQAVTSRRPAVVERACTVGLVALAVTVAAPCWSLTIAARSALSCAALAPALVSAPSFF